MNCQQLFVVVIAFLCIQPVYAEKLKINIEAEKAILINADTGAVLYEKNAHDLAYPASITKVATALFALERQPVFPDEMITPSPDALATIPSQQKLSSRATPPYRLTSDGTHMGLKVGETMSFHSLLYGMMLSSANDAANAIAEYVSGSVSQFMVELNTYLHNRGWRRTTFYNPHGLHHPNHCTTAYEMAQIARAAMRHPIFREVVKTVQYTRPQTNKQPPILLHQTNRLLKRGDCFYPKATGIKTGYTLHAKHTLVAAAEHNDRRLIAVLLGCSESRQRFTDAITVFESAFNEEKVVRTLFTKEYDFFSTSVRGGCQRLEAGLVEDVKIAYYPSEEPELKTVVRWSFPSLPIVKEACVGALEVWDGDRLKLAAIALQARNDVEMTLIHRLGSWYIREGKVFLLVILGLGVCLAAFFLHKGKKS